MFWRYDLDAASKGPPGKIRSTWGVIRNPKGLFEKAVAKYGDPFCLTAMNGPVLVTGKPDFVEQIFRAPPETFNVFGRDAMVPLLGSGSLLLMEGTKHRVERKRVAPPLHGSCMRTYGKTMQSTAQAAISQIDAGTAFTGLQIGTDISLDVILKTILGADTDRLLGEFRVMTREVLSRSWPILFFSPKTQGFFSWPQSDGPS